MKTTIFSIFLGLLLITSHAHAQFSGINTTVAPDMTVEQAQAAPSNSYVSLIGNIVSTEGGNYYIFRDQTGDMRVEIETSVWQGQSISSDTTVRLFGEVERGTRGSYIWVETLTPVIP